MFGAFPKPHTLGWWLIPVAHRALCAREHVVSAMAYVSAGEITPGTIPTSRIGAATT